MNLMTKSIRTKLLENGAKADPYAGVKPVVKFFHPCGAATWLICGAVDKGDDLMLFGLCDLGLGCAELGALMLSELESIRGPYGLGIERDLHWKASKSIDQYAEEAYAAGYIVA